LSFLKIIKSHKKRAIRNSQSSFPRRYGIYFEVVRDFLSSCNDVLYWISSE